MLILHFTIIHLPVIPVQLHDFPVKELYSNQMFQKLYDAHFIREKLHASLFGF